MASRATRTRGSCRLPGAQKSGLRHVCRTARTWYDRRPCRVRDLPCGALRIYLEFDLRRVNCRRCGGVKRERLDWLAANPHYTKRFALYVGKQCRSASIKEVADDLWLDWHAVKEMDKVYMQEQLARAGPLRLAVIGIDEISVRKGNDYRIVVSDLERHEPIWFGGVDRSEESMTMFYDFLGAARTKHIRLAVMDMWRAFRNATEAQAPQAAILYDKDIAREALAHRLGGFARKATS